MNDKAYKKIYVNGDCIVDFTEQTSNEYNIPPLQTFFNEKGELVKGKDDTWAFGSDAYILQSAYEIYGCLTDPILYLNNSEKAFCNFNIEAVSSGFEHNTFKKYISTIFLSEANLKLLLDNAKDSTTFNSQSCFSIIVPTVNTLSSIQLETLHKMSDYCGIQIFIMDAKPNIDTFNSGYLVYNCSEICQTEDQVFSYVKAENKVYIIGVHVNALNQMLDSSDNHVLNFPDTVENLPVASIGGSILKGRFFDSNNWADVQIADIDGIHLPNNLEILGGQSLHLDFAEPIKITLPHTLKSICSPTYSYPYDTFGSGVEDAYEFSVEPAEDGNYYLPEISAPVAILIAIANDLGMSGLYLATQTNPYYIYTGSGEENSTITIQDGCNYIASLPDSTTSITFPSTLKTYPKLEEMSELTTINFTETTEITELPQNFVNNCDALTSINIPEGVTSIPSNFVNNCDALTSINIPEGVTKLDYACFKGCKITDITLPSTLEYISSYAFYEPNGTDLKTIRVKAQTPPILQHKDGIARSTTSVYEIIVPQGCSATYKATSNWSSYASNIKDEELTE